MRRIGGPGVRILVSDAIFDEVAELLGVKTYKKIPRPFWGDDPSGYVNGDIKPRWDRSNTYSRTDAVDYAQRTAKKNLEGA